MARMFPNSLNPEDVLSRAEAPLFELFRTGLPDDYTVLHGVRWYIPRSEGDPASANSEADFLLLHPVRGLLVVEAKAGRLEYSPDKGKWKIIAEEGRAGSWKKSGPLEQAQGHRYALQRALERAYQERGVPLPKFTYGFAVAIPESRYDGAFDAFGLPRCLTLDIDALADVPAWVEGAFAHFGGGGGPGEELERVVEILTGGPRFASTLRERMLLLNRTIDALTRSQYEILNYLRGHRRVAIAGCAGSGKSLLAIEQAIRLRRRGLRTLLLCHNPHLAAYLRAMTDGTGVEASDLASWLADLRATGAGTTPRDWSHYFEPTEQELGEAFDGLLASDRRYDAVIVDEAQDFRGTWWTVVEAALRDPAEGFLYAFHDDNQALLPERTEYPITAAPFVLSKNCRNAGRIFELVRRFHDQAPEPNVTLAGRGEVQLWPFRFGGGPEMVATTLRELHPRTDSSNLVVLTTEYEPASKSVLEGLEVTLPRRWDWESTVRSIFTDARRVPRSVGLPEGLHVTFPMSALEMLERALLRVQVDGDGAVRHDDVESVVGAAQRVRRMVERNGVRFAFPGTPRCAWSLKGTNMRLEGMRSPHDVVAFFDRPNWFAGLAGRSSVKLVSEPRPLTADAVRLSTTEAFKGLEADHVVLFVPGEREELAKHLYVGVSRARGSLHVVVAGELERRVPGLPLFPQEDKKGDGHI